MSDIIGCLELVASEALALGIDLSKNLRPPATLSQIATDSEGLPFQLTKEVADLYVWHDGVWPEGQTSEYCVFPMFFYPPVKNATFLAKELLREQNRDRTYDFWTQGWYPIFTDLAGSYYVIDLNPKSNEFDQIIKLSEGLKPWAAHRSLINMLEYVLACYRAGAYFVDEDGFLDEDCEISIEVYERFCH